MSIGGLSRAASPRVHNRPRNWRAIGYAIALGTLIVLLGTQPHGQPPSRTGPRLSVTVADAATSIHRATTELDRDGMNPGAHPSAAIETVTPDPIFAAVRPADIPSDLFFDPSSLIASTPTPRIDMSDMVLRSDTLRPSDPITAEAAATTAALSQPSVPATVPAEASSVPVPKLTGTWAPDRSACSRRSSSFLPMVIDEKGARAGTSSCRFDRTRQTGNRWAIAATCRNGQEQWSASVKLVVEGTQMTWSSERGTEHYQRCR